MFSEEDLSNLPTISIRYKIPGLPCKYNTKNRELLICSTNVRCPKGFLDVGNQMCQPISDIKANGLVTQQQTRELSTELSLPNMVISDLFIGVFILIISGAVFVFLIRLLFYYLFSMKEI